MNFLMCKIGDFILDFILYDKFMHEEPQTVHGLPKKNGFKLIQTIPKSTTLNKEMKQKTR